MASVRFGLNVSTAVVPGADPVGDARLAEDLGFDFVSSNDHPAGGASSYETWTMLSWIAAATTRIRGATRVLGVPYRNPALVAKMAETFDRLSGGRLILGIGGGASDEEFRAFGLGAWSPRDKVDGLEEAIRITRGLWSERSFTFGGRLHRTEAAELEPKPEHRIPIWLGTLGPRALDVTGRLADGWIPSLENAPPDRAPAMRERILAAASAAGRDADEITCVYNVTVRVDERPDPDPSAVSGPPDAVAEQLIAFTRIGFGAMNLVTAGPDPRTQAERLANEVIPAVRAAARGT
jgi:alkanesulfonate monooxygenase SsuD/methylene tetrahydromethanopterin reductase-like flavin-dependent oxidoreductase (luciferase family)